MKVAYFYFMIDDPDRARAVASQHVAYWRGLALPGYLGGPFVDRSGGLITFEVESSEEAERFARNDPFCRQGLLRSSWLKQWLLD
jgi:uncharacterized protein YciI